MEATLPSSYARWRRTALGDVTERIEQQLVFELAGPLANLRVLDVGCGDGTLAIASAKQGATTTGIDSAFETVATARRAADEHHVDAVFEVGDACSLPFNENSFDVILAITILCLVEDPDRAVREMARVLKPGGRFVVGELGRFSSWAALRRIRGWLGSNLWRQARFHSASELRALVASAGLAVERTEAAIYYPPLDIAARVLARFDAWPRRLTTLGAAFIAVAGRKPDPNEPRPGGTS